MNNNGGELVVLVTVFACNPSQGSEPGIGWGWVVSLSKVCRLTVLTTTCNREGIEGAAENGQGVDAEFIYLDVTPKVQRLNKRAKSKVGVLVRLVLWQQRVKRFLKKNVGCQDYDILHHLTLGSFRMPFSVSGHGVVSVVGPVGGCEEFPEHLLPEASLRVRYKEILRNWGNRIYTRYGLGMKRYQSVDLTLSCTREMSEVFQRYGVVSPVFPNIGMPSMQGDVLQQKKNRSKGLQLLFVGNLLYWKGLGLALLVLKKMGDDVKLSVIGAGADRDEFKADIARLGLDGRVRLLGSMPRKELLGLYGEYDVFFYPSLHDSGAMSVVEAMRAGLPVICLDAGGPGISVTPECGRIVPLGSKVDVVAGLSEAVGYYLSHPQKIGQHGANASLRVKEEYNWDENAHRMVGLYQKVIEI